VGRPTNTDSTYRETHDKTSESFTLRHRKKTSTQFAVKLPTKYWGNWPWDARKNIEKIHRDTR